VSRRDGGGLREEEEEDVKKRKKWWSAVMEDSVDGLRTERGTLQVVTGIRKFHRRVSLGTGCYAPPTTSLDT
jgi:hypothetical protein